MIMGEKDPQQWAFRRESNLLRFNSRVNHYRFFLYKGISGVGKTTLLYQLGNEAHLLGFSVPHYLNIYPGEGIVSIVARLKRTFRPRSCDSNLESAHASQNIYTILYEILSSQRLTLLLDNIHHMDRASLIGLIQFATKNAQKEFVIIASSREDVSIGALDAKKIHEENLVSLTFAECVKIMDFLHIDHPIRDIVQKDVQRLGVLSHPLALQYFLSAHIQGIKQFPTHQELINYSSRSSALLRKLFESLIQDVPKHIVEMLNLLGYIGTPLPISSLRGIGLDDFIRTCTSLHLINAIHGQITITQLIYLASQKHSTISDSLNHKLTSALELYAHNTGDAWAFVAASQIYGIQNDSESALKILNRTFEYPADSGFYENFLKIAASIPQKTENKQQWHLLTLHARAKGQLCKNALLQIEKIYAEDNFDFSNRFYALQILCQLAFEHKQYSKAYHIFQQILDFHCEDAESIQKYIDIGKTAFKSAIQENATEKSLFFAKKLTRRIDKFLENAPNSLKNELKLSQAEVFFVMAKVYANSKNYTAALYYGLKSVKLFEEEEDFHQCSQNYTFIAEILRETQRFKKAISYHNKSYFYAQKSKDINLEHIASMCLCWTYLAIDNIYRAHTIWKSSVENWRNSIHPKVKRLYHTLDSFFLFEQGHFYKSAVNLTKLVTQWVQSKENWLSQHIILRLVRALLSDHRLEAAQNQATKLLSKINNKNILKIEIATMDFHKKLFNEGHKKIQKIIENQKNTDIHFRLALSLYRENFIEEAEYYLNSIIAHYNTQASNKSTIPAAFLLLKSKIGFSKKDYTSSIGCIHELIALKKQKHEEYIYLQALELLVQNYLILGDFNQAKKWAIKCLAYAQNYQHDEIRLRIMAMMCILYTRQLNFKHARNCFRFLAHNGFNLSTRVLMARAGEALFALQRQYRQSARCQIEWTKALHLCPMSQRIRMVSCLVELNLHPQQYYKVYSSTILTQDILKKEEMALYPISSYDLWVDILAKKIIIHKRALNPQHKLYDLMIELLSNHPNKISWEKVMRCIQIQEKNYHASLGKKIIQQLDAYIKTPLFVFSGGNQGLGIKINSDRWMIWSPSWWKNDLSEKQTKILQSLSYFGQTTLSALSQELGYLEEKTVILELEQLCAKNIIQKKEKDQESLYWIPSAQS
jgi:hypothetical protein